MSAAAANAIPIPWWKEPTKDQWLAWVAAWLGWTLDSFDFTIFLLLMVPIAKDFGVPLTEVAIVFTLTLWMRLVGATASGWLADRIGRKKPLMISIAWFSVCNLFAGLAPSFWLLLLFRTALGIGMGAEWPAGAALAMETWPQRSRGQRHAELAVFGTLLAPVLDPDLRLFDEFADVDDRQGGQHAEQQQAAPADRIKEQGVSGAG